MSMEVPIVETEGEANEAKKSGVGVGVVDMLKVRCKMQLEI